MREIARFAPVYEVSEEDLHFYEAEAQGDLAYKLDLESGVSSCARYVYSKASLVHDNRVYGHGSLLITECQDAPPTTCVLFGDSACFAMLNFLAQSFGRLVFLQTPMVDYELIKREQPDVVVTEMVERFMIEIPIDSVAPSLEQLEEGVRTRGPERPRIRFWDPSPEPVPEAIPPTVEAIEAARARLLSRGRREDALIVTLMAYAGLFPHEALALNWQQIRGDVLLPESLDTPVGAPDDTKRPEVRLMKPLAEELSEWRIFCGSPEFGMVFPGLRTVNWKRWARRVYRRAVKGDVALENGPEFLYRTFTTLLIRSGASPSEVAWQSGRPRSEIVDTYYFIWDKRSHNAEADDVSEAISRVRSSIASRTRTVSFPVRLLSRVRHDWRMLRAWLSHSLGRDKISLSAETVERIRARLLADGQHEEATLVSVMAYAGLLQGEATSLKWRQIEDSKLTVETVRIGHASKETPKRFERSITLLEPLAEDLASWRAESGHPKRGYVFPSFLKRDWQEWVSEDYQRAAKPAGRGWRRPAMLGRTFCALLIAEGVSLDDVARQAGLSRGATISQYFHLLVEARSKPPVSAAVQIRAARAAVFKSS
jgi:integrase